jgi:hypothetical protein
MSLEELRATVERMESRLRAQKEVRELVAAYDELVPQFASDLPDERERLLSQGGALMLIQEIAAKRRAASRR